MKIFTIILAFVLIISGITTLTSYQIIIRGISDPTVYKAVQTVAMISAITTFISLVLVCVRVVILIQQHMRNRK